jgi:hypothetical protein
MSRRILAALVGSLLGMTVAIAAVADKAQAALADCWNSTVCLFAHTNYGNPIWRQVEAEIPGCRSLVGTGWNDVTTSAANQYTYGIVLVLWQHSNCTGWYYQLPGDTIVNFAGYPQDNQISAVSLIRL